MPSKQQLNDQNAGEKSATEIHRNTQQQVGTPLLCEQTLEQQAVI